MEVAFALTCAIAAVAAGAVALGIWRRYDGPGARMLVVVMVLVAQWSLSSAFETLSVDFDTKLFWAKADYIGITATPLALLVFTARYTSLDQWLTARRLAALTVIPLATLLLDWTDELHGLVHSHRELIGGGPFTSWSVTYGPIFWVNAAFQYAVLAAAVVVGFQALFRPGGLYRRQATSLMVGLIVPWAANLGFISGLSPWKRFDFTVSAFAITGLAVTWGLVRGRLFDLAPVARAAVLQSMSSAVLVIDRQGRLTDLNPAAQTLLGPAAHNVLGRAATQVLVGWPGIAEPLSTEVVTTTEFNLGTGPLGRTFELRITPLRRGRGPPVGRLILAHDVTERTHAENERARRVAEQAAREESEAARRRAALLAEISGQLADSLELDAVLFRFKKSLIPAFADGLFVELLTESGLGVQIAVEYATDEGADLLVEACPRWTRTQRTPAQEPIDAAAVQEVVRPLLVREVRDHMLTAIGCTPKQIRVWHTLDPRSIVRAPMSVRGQLIGILYLVAGRLRGPFEAADLALAENLAYRAALALENVRLYRTALHEIAERVRVESLLEQEAVKRRVLADLEHTALVAADSAPLAGQAVRAVAELLDARYVAVVEQTRRTLAPLSIAASAGWSADVAGRPPHELLGISPSPELSEPLVVDDWQTEQRLARQSLLIEHDVQSTAIIPVQLPSRGRPFAWLAVHATRPGGFAPADVGFLERVAHILALALDRKQGDEALRRFARRSATIQEDDRRLLARELHDEIGQQLTGLHLLLGMIAPGTPAARSRLDDAQRLVGDLLGRVRDLSLELRPTVLDDLGLAPALTWLVDRFVRLTGVHVMFEHDGMRRLTSLVETAAYRIVQEALTNVARHARTSAATVQIRIVGKRLLVRVADSGCGFEVNEAAYWAETNGLASMRERAAAAGGSISITSQPGVGTCVTAEFRLNLPGRASVTSGARRRSA